MFPVLTDELVSEYQQRATKAERREAKEWFRVERVVNAQSGAHIVPYALYRQPLRKHEPDFTPATPASIRKGSKGAPAFYKHQVAPMLRGAKAIRKARPEVVVRVYLAKDSEFLADELAAAGCEICVMATSSLRHAPGALWRFLPLGEKGKVVTLSDPIYSERVIADIGRTEEMLRAGLGVWRVPDVAAGNMPMQFGYRPIGRSQFGAIGGYAIEWLAAALIWHTQRRNISTKCTPPGGCGEQHIAGAVWPNIGFDEWFLLSAFYPRAARKGILTLASAATTSLVLPLDVEYATWANPRSETVYFGEAAHGCCAPKPEIEKKNSEKKKREKISDLEIPYWNKWEKLPLLMNLQGMCGTAVKLGARNGEESADFLAAWRGKQWHVVEQWKPRGKTEWVDSENFRTQAEWDNLRVKFDKALRGDKRVKVIEKTDEQAAKQFKLGSLDLVWLNEDRSFQGTLATIERWWPLLREGGIMAGVGGKDCFVGSGEGRPSWHAVYSALLEWRRRTGIGFFLTTDGKDGWLMFKSKLPKPKDVLIITGATKEVAYAATSTANHRAYCKKWGYKYHVYGEEGFDRSRALQWSKIRMMKDALHRSKWVIWIDCDAVFNDWSVPISRLCIEPFEHISPIWDFENTVRPSSGVFVMRQGEWAQSYLQSVWDYPRNRQKFPHEEVALWSVTKRDVKNRKKLFAVDPCELNSAATVDGRMNHPVLHFMMLGEVRPAILEDACKMIEQRNK